MRTFIKENTWMSGMDVGYANGYVIIPKGHPAHGKDYDEIDVDVHGGLTFSANAKDLDKDLWSEIMSNEDGWIVGFDTMHYGDTQTTCDKEYVMNEVENLKNQLIVIATE